MKNDIKALLVTNMLPLWQRIYDENINNTVLDFIRWKKSETNSSSNDTAMHLHNMLCRFITHKIEEHFKFISTLNERYTLFSGQVQRAVTQEEQWQHQKKFLQFMGCSTSQLKSINKARKRWFGNDTIKDRYQNTVSHFEHELNFLMARLAELITLFAKRYDNHNCDLLFNTLKLDEKFNPILLYENDERVAYEAIHCIKISYAYLTSDPKNDQLLQHIYRIASDPHLPIWVQTEALDLLFYLNPNSFTRLLQYRLVNPSNVKDDLFYRSRALEAAIQHQSKISDDVLNELVTSLCSDPSPFVRQQLANNLPKLSKALRFDTYSTLTSISQPIEVQAKAWLISSDLLSTNDVKDSVETQKTFIDRFLWGLTHQPDGLLLRLLMELAPELMQCLVDHNQATLHDEFYQQCLSTLTRIHTSHEQTSIRRWAAQARETLWHIRHSKPAFDQLNKLESMALESQIKLKRPKIETDELGRQLATNSSKGFGHDIHVKKNILVVRAGYALGFRLWRFIHELMTPSTDKRQNHNHIQGKHFYGHVQVPSQLLGEASETNVPGEPVIIKDEQGWRPYLPLLDQILSSLDQGWPTKSIKIFTSEGTTEIMPPSNIFNRIWAKLYISFHFKRLADLRNWQENDTYPAHAYLQSFAKLGFEFRIHSYKDETQTFPVDKRVGRFFPAVFPVFAISEFWRDIQNYFYSVYQNTLEQLGVFLVAVSALFFGQHFLLNHRFRKSRKLIPLVIGGWGTRGKSGTERLKSALFNGQGISLVSKSTGCEAQFLYAPTNRPLRELFLFRPYDKASIWEQLQLTRLAEKLKVNVFLWECMGLTPRYINILQEQWMRDDLSTITNCYPDHENIQGPSGIDIPKVMMRFVPNNATIISSEDSMSPLLESAAIQKNSHYRKVSWIDAHFIASDILERFPYEEHPTNIALVLKMADELDFKQDIALKSMADNVIPDLGVLKIYPQSYINHRNFTFINAMSANERLAALNSWHRLKLDKISVESEPNTWLTTLVNNRADRISRSQVFAKMLANDLSADQHVLIGTNIDGLLQYIEDQWRVRIDRSFSDIQHEYQAKTIIKRLKETCTFIRVPITHQQIQVRIQSIFKNLNIDASVDISIQNDDISHLTQYLSHLDDTIQDSIINLAKNLINESHQYSEIIKKINNPDDPITLDEVHDLTWEWFRRRLIVVEDPHIDGNALIALIMSHTPAGLSNKMIGLQNIKGTGLDFVYRWQAWDKVSKLCNMMDSKIENQALSAAKELANIKELGLLDEKRVLQVCKNIRNISITQTELFQAELNTIESNMNQQISDIQRQSGADIQESTIVKLINALESFLDAGQSVKRKKLALCIYDDLASQTISIDRAIAELNKLNKEQKGGWLIKKLTRKFKFIQ